MTIIITIINIIIIIIIIITTRPQPAGCRGFCWPDRGRKGASRERRSTFNSDPSINFAALPVQCATCVPTELRLCTSRYESAKSKTTWVALLV